MREVNCRVDATGFLALGRLKADFRFAFVIAITLTGPVLIHLPTTTCSPALNSRLYNKHTQINFRLRPRYVD